MWQLCFDIDQHIPEDFGHWLAGFVDGEGCFRIRLRQRNGYYNATAELKITLRADDRGILQQIRDVTKVGVLRDLVARPSPGRENAKPQVEWSVTRINDIILVIIPLFENYPLRAKKKKDFEIWAKAARLIHSGGHLTKRGRLELTNMMFRLKTTRRYKKIGKEET